MKIVDVTAHALAVPAHKSSINIDWVAKRLTQVVVEIKTEDGLTGWGEAFSYGVTQAVVSVIHHTLKPMLIGQSANNIGQLSLEMAQKTHLAGRYGITTFAISGVEIALWDLCGKRANMPLCDLLGGAANREVAAYASLVRYPEGDPQIAQAAKEAMQQGYTGLKLHQSSVQSVQLARETIGADVPLTVDINCQWTPQQALLIALGMSEYDLYWLEEPVWPPEDYAGLATLQANSALAIASGENACTAYQFHQMAQAGITYLQPSVIKVGGVREWLHVAHIAKLYSLELAPHSPYFGPGFAATLHLIAHTNQARWIEQIAFSLEQSLFTQPLPFAEGTYTLPPGPGLGVEVNRDVLKEYATTSD